MSENKKDPGKNSREKAGTKFPPIIEPPVPPVPNRAHTELRTAFPQEMPAEKPREF